MYVFEFSRDTLSLTKLGDDITDESLDSYGSTSPDLVPEHRQFVEMMYDIHAYTQRQHQIGQITALNQIAASSELGEELNLLHIQTASYTQSDIPFPSTS